ncbi:MAG TPA: PAS domain-containing protein [Acidimicrobiales bacterium]|nr:PAS domain-containing protein [Acidimicrobiales bacterium]
MVVRDIDLAKQDGHRAYFPGGSRELLDEVPGVCGSPLVVWGSGGTILLANQAALDLIGLSAEEQIGRSLLDLGVVPRHATGEIIAAFVDGTLDRARTKVALSRPGAEALAVWAWSRSTKLDGGPVVVSLVIPASDIGRLEHDIAKPWRDLAPIAVGVADGQWAVQTVSTETQDIFGLPASECIGLSLLALVHPEDRASLSRLDWDQIGPVVPRSGLRLARPGGGWAKVCLLVARPWGERDGRMTFALAGAGGPATASVIDRVEELELRLRRIGAEVRTAGVFDDRGWSAGREDHPALGEISTRQWEILDRLLSGQRVPTIAKELYLSRSTVRSHLAAIFRKFGVHSQPELLDLLRQRRECA